MTPTAAIEVECVNCAKSAGDPCGVLPNGKAGFCLARLLSAACHSAATLQKFERNRQP